MLSGASGQKIFWREAILWAEVTTSTSTRLQARIARFIGKKCKVKGEVSSRQRKEDKPRAEAAAVTIAIFVLVTQA